MTTPSIVSDGVAVLMVVGLVQLVKDMLPATWSKFLPAFALAFGIIWVTLLHPTELAIGQQIIAGVTIGLMAIGGQSGTKNLAEGFGWSKDPTPSNVTEIKTDITK